MSGLNEVTDSNIEIESAFMQALTLERDYILTDMPTEEFIDEYVYIENKDNPGEPTVKFEMCGGR